MGFFYLWQTKNKLNTFKIKLIVIYIAKNSLNNVVLTLSESSTLTNPFYLFEFINEWQVEENPTSIFFTTPDISDYTERYNLFQITESITGSTTGGTNVALSLTNGQYKYNVYEASASTLSISATTGVIIESGRQVVGDVIQTLNNNTIDSPSMGIYD